MSNKMYWSNAKFNLKVNFDCDQNDMTTFLCGKNIKEAEKEIAKIIKKHLKVGNKNVSDVYIYMEYHD